MRPAMLKIDLGIMWASSAIDASRGSHGRGGPTETAAVGGLRLTRGRAGEEEPLAHGDGPALHRRGI